MRAMEGLNTFSRFLAAAILILVTGTFAAFHIISDGEWMGDLDVLNNFTTTTMTECLMKCDNNPRCNSIMKFEHNRCVFLTKKDNEVRDQTKDENQNSNEGKITEDLTITTIKNITEDIISPDQITEPPIESTSWGSFSACNSSSFRSRKRICTHDGRTKYEESQVQACPNCTWLQQGKQEVCFGSYVNQRGTFTVTMDGMLSGVMLEYTRGGVSCNANILPVTNWGCANGINTLFVLITKGQTAIFPPDPSRYTLPGVTNMDPKLTLLYPKSGIKVAKGTVLNVVYIEDFKGGYHDNPKNAKTCANVYAKFNC